MKFRMLALAFGAAVLASSAFGATVVCSGISDVTSSNLFIPSQNATYSNSDGCYVPGSGSSSPDLVFNNFVVQPSAGFTSAIVGITGSSVSGGEAYLDFSIGAIQTTPGGNTNNGDIKLFYQITGGTVGADIHLQATPGSGGGNVTINEVVCSDPFVNQTCQGTTLANFQAVSSGQTVNVYQGYPGGEPDTSVYVKKDIQFNNASISEFTNSAQVPEPMTLSMMGLGLLAIGLVGRRRMSK